MDTMKNAPTTDTTVLGRNWMLNPDDEALKSAVKSILFELDVRENRREVGRHAAARSAERAAEVRDAIDSVNAQTEAL